MTSHDLSNSLQAAQGLLGWKLVYESHEGRTAGYIVETEAYDMHDPASHAYGGERGRNTPMYQAAGTIYVYLIYGMHSCVNIVTGPKGHGQAVLIRALEPTDGLEIMRSQRPGVPDIQLTNGPAKLVQAMGITTAMSGKKLGDKLFLEPGVSVQEITQTTRIGISKAVDQPWRFYIKGNTFVSKT
jgi:DNA-3-methyladenine glycosylase